MERSKHFAKQKGARNCEDGKEEHSSKQKRQKLFGSSSRNPMKRSIEHEPLTLQAYLRDLEVNNDNPTSALIFIRPNSINQNYLHLPTKLAKLVKPFTSANGYITLRVSDASVRTWQLKMVYSGEQIILSAGWPKFRQENNLKQGDCCVFMLTEGDSGAVIDVVKFHHNNTEECRLSSGSARALAFQNENPSSALIFMSPRSFNYYSLHLPIKFAKLVRPFTSANGNITLRVSDASVRTWQLKTVYTSSDYICLRAGWPKFRRENNLKPGDWCVLMLTEEDIGAVIDVVIFRDNNDEECRSSQGVEDVTAVDRSGCGQAENDSDSSLDPSLHIDESDEDVPHVSSTSSKHAVGSEPLHPELSNVETRFVPLLDEVCSRHPSLIESKKKNTPLFTKWAFIFLGEVLYFLKTKRVKDMTDDACADLELSWKELIAFKFDLSWLEPHVQRALGMNKVAGKVNGLRKDVADMEEEANILRTKLEKARRDLKEAEEDINVEIELGYEV